MDPHDVLIRPLLTEKGTQMREELNKICFMVHPSANRKRVKQAVEQTLKVKVEKVNMVNMRGKGVRTGKFEGKRPDWKKAIVTLKEGEKLSLFEG